MADLAIKVIGHVVVIGLARGGRWALIAFLSSGESNLLAVHNVKKTVNMKAV